MEDIIQGHKKLNNCEDNNLIPELFLSLEYRFKKANGEWIWLQELKFVTLTDGRIDKVLGLLIDIDEQRQLEEAQTRSNASTNVYSPKLLDIAIQFKNVNKKMWIKKPTDESLPTSQPPGIALLTKREKEVLQLVGDGFSTKQISDKLNISINTVETHRRHLLEKLQVKNSMELIKEASKVFWF
jgi:two-component system response regulator NreC